MKKVSILAIIAVIFISTTAFDRENSCDVNVKTFPIAYHQVIRGGDILRFTSTFTLKNGTQFVSNYYCNAQDIVNYGIWDIDIVYTGLQFNKSDVANTRVDVILLRGAAMKKYMGAHRIERGFVGLFDFTSYTGWNVYNF